MTHIFSCVEFFKTDANLVLLGKLRHSQLIIVYSYWRISPTGRVFVPVRFSKAVLSPNPPGGKYLNFGFSGRNMARSFKTKVGEINAVSGGLDDGWRFCMSWQGGRSRLTYLNHISK